MAQAVQRARDELMRTGVSLPALRRSMPSDEGKPGSGELGSEMAKFCHDWAFFGA